MAFDLSAFDTVGTITPTVSPAPAEDGPMVVTFSALQSFMNCRKLFENKQIKCLVPIANSDEKLRFGTMMHACLEKWHSGAGLQAVMDYLDTACEKRNVDADVKAAWHLARAMMRGYASRYATEDFKVEALEKTFEGPIVNPETNKPSRSFRLAGKVDGIVRVDTPTLDLPAGHYILEHKTASGVDADYLDKLWTDLQITIYAHYIETVLGIPITGIIYNVLVKSRISQKEGETYGEYVERYRELCAKNKSGKSTATQRMPETDEEFDSRLDEVYAKPESFVRQAIFLDRSRIPLLQETLWDLTKNLLEARRRGIYYPNTAHCYAFHRPCVYKPLCKSGDNPILRDNLYQIAAPNSELQTESSEPVF